jgi:hypothetical protein
LTFIGSHLLRPDYGALRPVLLVFFEGMIAFLAILTCPFNVAPLIKKVRRNVEFDALMKRD